MEENDEVSITRHGVKVNNLIISMSCVPSTLPFKATEIADVKLKRTIPTVDSTKIFRL